MLHRSSKFAAVARRSSSIFTQVRSVSAKGSRELDIVIYGSTGFTGRLVAEYMNNQYGVNGDIKWGMAGRSQSKLESVRDEMGISKDVPLVVADTNDQASITSMVKQSKVVLTTVGPYQKYGNEVVATCAAEGTDYVDLCGEPGWMAEMIAKHSKAAEDSGARIVFSVGFDSIPFDLGVFRLQQAALAQHGEACARVRGRVKAMKGTWSGGTLASFKETMKAMETNKDLMKTLLNPFALTPGFAGVAQPPGHKPIFDDVLQSWCAPFVMASINTKNVHRSNLLLDHMYGKDFQYDEMILTGPGEKGEAIAKKVHKSKAMEEDQTQPGDGPSKEEREAGFYDLTFVGETKSGHKVQVDVKGDKDPGYGSTSKMIAEGAVCLVKDAQAAGGIWTPAPAMGAALIDRLQANAGLIFTVK